MHRKPLADLTAESRETPFAMNWSRDVFYPESLKSQTLFENHKISPSLSTTKLNSQLHGLMPAGTQGGEQGSALQQLEGHTTGLTY